jgi:DDE superfamily endonuclease
MIGNQNRRENFGVVPEIEALEMRKRLVRIVTSVIVLFFTLLQSRRENTGVPLFQRPLSPLILQTFLTSEDIDECAPAIQLFKESLWARIIALDQYAADPTRKSEQPFWDVYRGSDEFWHKEYRMSKETFNGIVRDTVPFLYSRPTISLKIARYRYIRAKVVMATLIRYLAIQSDQHALGKEFGVRQPCISKRIDRGCRALLSAYHYEGCPDPKIVFPLEEGRRTAAASFYGKCRIPYLCGSIDGSIIKIASPSAVSFIPREFWSKRKQAYSLNLMVICDHRKRFMFADSRWPGSTCDTGAVARSRFLTNLFVNRGIDLFPQPYMFLADGGFHKRTCFIAPDLQCHNRVESLFNTSISAERVALLKTPSAYSR